MDESVPMWPKESSSVQKSPKVDRKVDGWIEDLAGAICDPIIVMPGGWGDTLPDWVKGQIKIERLLENMAALHEHREITATDAEAMAYLYTASLEGPMDGDWVQIYLYISSKTMKAASKAEPPKDILVEKLTPDQERDLKHLKFWIYERRVKHRHEKNAEERRAEKSATSEEKQVKPAAKKEQPVLMESMFKF